MLGIYPVQSNQSPSFNYKMPYILLSIASFFLASFTFFISEANSAMEYGMTFSDTLLDISSAIFYIVNMIRMPNIIKLIENCEDFIDKSKICFGCVFFVLFQAYFFTNRTALFGSARNLQGIESKNRKNDEFFLLRFNLPSICGSLDDRSNNCLLQLLHFGYGRRFV